MNKRGGLGRGLDALIPQLDVSESDAVTHIAISDLRPNPYQPRRSFDEEKLRELAESIQEHGIIQPLVVRKSSVKGFEIVAGERRYRAAKLLGLQTVPSVVREFTDVQLMEVAIIENLQREDLTAVEIAEAYASLMGKCGLTQEQLAKRVGQSRSHVANMLRLLQLPTPIIELVSRGTLSMGHARTLLAVEEPSRQLELAAKVEKEDLSVRRLEALVYQPENRVSRETNTKKDKAKPQYIHIRRYEDQLRSHLGTSVRIHQGKKRGKIEIEYFSDEDLERILNLINTRNHDGGA